MTRAAPRIDPRLIEALLWIDSADQPIAETNRRIGAAAERLMVPRPSYERVRTLVHAIRAGDHSPTVAAVLLDIAFRVRPAVAVVDLLE